METWTPYFQIQCCFWSAKLCLKSQARSAFVFPQSPLTAMLISWQILLSEVMQMLFPKNQFYFQTEVLGTSVGTPCRFSSHSHSPLKIETLQIMGKMSR